MKVYSPQYKVNATSNWCGSADGPGGKGSGSGDNVSENVLYLQWLKEPGIVSLPPTAYIDSVIPNPALQGKTVSFVGYGIDLDGTIVAYNWRSSIDGQLSTFVSFRTFAFSGGTHTIYFKVQDDIGEWLSEVSEILVINSTGLPIEEAPLPYWALYVGIVAIIITLAISFVVIVKKRKKSKE